MKRRRVEMRGLSGLLVLTFAVLTALVLLTPLKGARQTEAAEAITAEQIIAQMAEKASQIKDLKGVIITGIRKSTFEFKRPLCFRMETSYTGGAGTGKAIFLLNDEDYWFWAPGRDEAYRRSALSVSSLYFYTSALVMFSLVPEKITQDAAELHLLGEERINDKNAYVVEMVPRKEEKPSRVYYTKLKFWIDTANLSPLKMETYRNEELKTETIAKEFKEVTANFWLPVKVTRLLRGSVTTSTLINIEVNKGIPDERFAPRLSENTLVTDGEPLSVQEYEEQLKSDPDNVNLLYNLGLKYRSNRDYEKAIEQLKKVVELRPNSKAGYAALGSAYGQAKRYEKKVDLYRKAIDKFPNYILFRSQLPSAYERLGKQDLAIEEYRKAIELNPESTHHYQGLASLYKRLGRKEEAIEVAEMLLERAPEDADTYSAAAQIYLHLGNCDKAIDYYKKAVDLAAQRKARFYGMMWVAPDQLKFEYQLRLAHAYGVVGKIEEAEKEYKRIMTESQNQLIIDRAQDGLSRLQGGMEDEKASDK